MNRSKTVALIVFVAALGVVFFWKLPAKIALGANPQIPAVAIINSGNAANPDNALGAPDNNFARVGASSTPTYNGFLVLDLGRSVPLNTMLALRMAEFRAAGKSIPVVDVDASVDSVTFTHLTSFTLPKRPKDNPFRDFYYRAGQDGVRYVRLRIRALKGKAEDQFVDVDAVRISIQIPEGVETLKDVAFPQDANLANFVVDPEAAKVLGKALFWDVAVSSDGQTACASCHFHAGVDVRTKNQLSPALNHQAGAPKNSTFDPTLSGNRGGPNYRMQPEDFPFFVLADPNKRDSAIVFQTDDVMSSQGVFSTQFVGATAGADNDQCNFVFDGRYHVGGVSTRRVEPRQTPTIINAIFNLRNFWDGRANETFNGVNPFGMRDPNAGIYQVSSQGNSIVKVQPNLTFSSLASQAVGPPTNSFEMACAGRVWPNVGRRLLNRIPLQNQAVAANDSLLGDYRAASGLGLNQTYQQLIDQAFAAAYRNNGWQVSINGAQYTLSEANFSFFFGIAVQLYESTLVSDDAPLDQYITGSNLSALNEQEIRGMNLFAGKGKCTACHSGPQLTNAGTPAIRDFLEGAIVSHMILGDGKKALYDEGFYNIGVRPTIEDLSLGGTDPFGNPLSFAAQYKAKLQTGQAFVDRRLTVDPCTFEVDPCKILSGGVRLAVDGAFKVPTLRNVELTGPYFHNGSRKNLDEVIEFYNRGGDRRGSSGDNTTGFGPNGSNLDADIESLGLTDQEKADLVAFLKRPLTDNRVRCDQAPFDHPQLLIPNGHVGDNNRVTVGANGVAADQWFTIPAVGANGMCGSDLSGQRLSFEEILAMGGLASAENALTGGIVLNTPLNPDSGLPADLALVELLVEEVVIEEEPTTLLEADVPATYTAEQNQRIYLPVIRQ